MIIKCRHTIIDDLVIAFSLLLLFSCSHLPAEVDKITGKPFSLIGGMAVDTRTHSTLDKIGEKLVEYSKNGGNYYHFWLVDTSEINALTLPGGYIYVFSGIIRILDTEDELAALLAHEIAHNEERHYAEQYDWKLPFSVIGEGISALSLGIIPNPIERAFSRKNETEADRVGMELMEKAGFCSKGMKSLIAKLHEVGSLGTPNKYVLTHPPTKERLKDIEGILEKKDSSKCKQNPLEKIELLRIPQHQ